MIGIETGVVPPVDVVQVWFIDGQGKHSLGGVGLLTSGVGETTSSNVCLKVFEI